jgi:hypothetical protein
MSDAQTVRDHLLYLLRGGGAHLDFESAVDDLPSRSRGSRPSGLPYSPWELVEHMRIAQSDILEFCQDADYESPEWPAGYWPGDPTPPDVGAWDRTIDNFRKDARAIQDLIADPHVDLFAPIPHGDGQTILREALLVADHNAYHIGQLIVVRRALGVWQD